MVSRRTIVAGTLSVLGGSLIDASLGDERARAGGAVPTLKVGLLPFGSVQWEIETLRLRGFDTAEGIRVEPVPLASTEAARIGFLSRSVDTIVQDLLFAARIDAEGRSVLFLPQSSTEGELLVPAASSIRSIADLILPSEVDHGIELFRGSSQAGGGCRRGRPVPAFGGAAIRGQRKLRDPAVRQVGALGSLMPGRQGRPRGSGKLEPHASFLIGTVEARPDITMPELGAMLLETHGVTAVPAMLSRWLCRRGFTFKENSDGLGMRTLRRERGTFGENAGSL